MTHVETEPKRFDEPSCRSRAEAWSARLVWLSVSLLIVIVGWNAGDAWRRHRQLHVIRCDEPVYDFGQGFPSQVVDHTFHVLNTSREPIKIDKVLVSCGCTTVAEDLEGTLIEGKAGFDVPARLILGRTPVGDVERSVVIRFEGDPRREVRLTLKGKVLREWTWSPDLLVLKALERSKPVVGQIRIQQHSEAPPCEIRSLSPAGDQISLKLRPASSARQPREWVLEVQARPPEKSRRKDWQVYLARTDGHESIGPIRIAVVVPDETEADE